MYMHDNATCTCTVHVLLIINALHSPLNIPYYDLFIASGVASFCSMPGPNGRFSVNFMIECYSLKVSSYTNLALFYTRWKITSLWMVGATVYMHQPIQGDVSLTGKFWKSEITAGGI